MSMRSYENSGYNPFNENDRGQSRGSARNYYSDEFDMNSNRIRGAQDSGNRNNRQSSGEFGSDRNTFGSSGYGNPSNQGRSNWGSSGDSYGSGSSYGSYGSGSSYGSSSGSSNSRLSDYRASNRHDNSDRWDRNDRNDSIWDRGSDRNQDSWDRAGNKIENTWERTKNKASNAWDRMTDSDDDNYSSRSSMPRNYNTYGTTGSSSNYGNTYGSRRDSDSNFGMGSRHSNDPYNRDRGHDRDHDRDFFDRAGDEVKSWFGDDEAERRRRMDEMRDRQEDRESNSYRRTGSTSYGNTYSGPPYSYGSSSRRDYEW